MQALPPHGVDERAAVGPEHEEAVVHVENESGRSPSGATGEPVTLKTGKPSRKSAETLPCRSTYSSSTAKESCHWRTNRRVAGGGDWNLLRGYGEHGDRYWQARYDTVFARAETLGLRFVGPEYPNGRQASPWPKELPLDSRCVPTFHHSGQSPGSATRQLDFVFASTALADRVHVRALNEPENWGPSDHCRVIIDVDSKARRRQA
jgi:hypothetical protein